MSYLKALNIFLEKQPKLKLIVFDTPEFWLVLRKLLFDGEYVCGYYINNGTSVQIAEEIINTIELICQVPTDFVKFMKDDLKKDFFQLFHFMICSLAGRVQEFKPQNDKFIQVANNFYSLFLERAKPTEVFSKLLVN